LLSKQVPFIVRSGHAGRCAQDLADHKERLSGGCGQVYTAQEPDGVGVEEYEINAETDSGSGQAQRERQPNCIHCVLGYLGDWLVATLRVCHTQDSSNTWDRPLNVIGLSASLHRIELM